MAQLKKDMTIKYQGKKSRNKIKKGGGSTYLCTQGIQHWFRKEGGTWHVPVLHASKSASAFKLSISIFYAMPCHISDFQIPIFPFSYLALAIYIFVYKLFMSEYNCNGMPF